MPPALLPVDVPAETRPAIACRACHRPLRDPESRALGVGPECQAEAYAARRWAIEQDTIPGME